MINIEHRTIWMASRTKVLPVIIGSVLLAGALALRAQPTVASLQSQFLDAYNDLQQAAADFQASVTTTGDQTNAINDIDAALGVLASITNNVTSTNIQAALGKKYKSVEKALTGRVVKAMNKANKALSDVEALSGLVEKSDPPRVIVGPVTYTQRKAVLQAIQAANAGVLSGGLLLGKPMVANRQPSKAGFYQPGAWAEFQIDTSGCSDVSVTVVNANSLSSPIDTSTVNYDTQTGVLRFQMGTDAGGGDVVVTGCGGTQSLEVYNYGKKPVAGVPLDFPQNLPTGTYVMTYSASGDVSIPTTTIGTYPMTNLRLFYDAITSAFNTAISEVSVAGCSQSVGYSPYSDNSFSITYSVTCTSGQYTSSESFVFTLTKE